MALDSGDGALPGATTHSVGGAGASGGGGRGRGRGGRAGHRAGGQHGGARPHGQQGPGGGESAPPLALRVVALPVWAADAAGLCAAYGCGGDGPERFTRDGVGLAHREALYIGGGGAASPLALVWKDGGCSRWAVDTDAGGGATPHQARGWIGAALLSHVAGRLGDGSERCGA